MPAQTIQNFRDRVDGLREIDRLWKKLDGAIESFECATGIQKVGITRLQIRHSVASFIACNTPEGEKHYDSC